MGFQDFFLDKESDPTPSGHGESLGDRHDRFAATEARVENLVKAIVMVALDEVGADTAAAAAREFGDADLVLQYADGRAAYADAREELGALAANPEVVQAEACLREAARAMGVFARSKAALTTKLSILEANPDVQAVCEDSGPSVVARAADDADVLGAMFAWTVRYFFLGVLWQPWLARLDAKRRERERVERGQRLTEAFGYADPARFQEARRSLEAMIGAYDGDIAAHRKWMENLRLRGARYKELCSLVAELDRQLAGQIRAALTAHLVGIKDWNPVVVTARPEFHAAIVQIAALRGQRVMLPDEDVQDLPTVHVRVPVRRPRPADADVPLRPLAADPTDLPEDPVFYGDGTRCNNEPSLAV